MIELIATFIEPLEHEGLRYLVTGSVAAMAYGEPRLTNDIDLILEIQVSDIPALTRAFPESDYYLPPAIDPTLKETERRYKTLPFNDLSR